MARKYVVLFIVITLCLFSLMSAFTGERGFFANKELERQLKANEYRLDRDRVELENLKIQEEELSTEDGIRSAAMNLGYKVDGDDVYRFETQDAVPSREKVLEQTVSSDAAKPFTPWSPAACLGLAAGASLVATLLVWIIGRKGKDSDDSEQDEPGNFGNNFNFD